MKFQTISVQQVKSLKIQLENNKLMNLEMASNIQQINLKTISRSIDKATQLKMLLNCSHNEIKQIFQNQAINISRKTEEQRLFHQNNLDEFQLIKEKTQQLEREIEQIIAQTQWEINQNDHFKTQRQEAIRKYFDLFDSKIGSYFNWKISQYQNQKIKNEFNDYLCVQSVALHHKRLIISDVESLSPQFVKLLQLFKDNKQDLKMQIDNIKDDLSIIEQQIKNWKQYQSIKEKIKKLDERKSIVKAQIKFREEEKQRLFEAVEQEIQREAQQKMAALLDRQSEQLQKMLEGFFECSQLIKVSVQSVEKVEGQKIQ